jgi:hypothetical protein
VLRTTASLRSRAWLNFADLGLWAQAWNLVKYIRSGDAGFQPYWLRVRGLGLVPFSQFHLSPVGPQIEVGTRYRSGDASGQFSVRWTEAIGGSRLVGSVDAIRFRRSASRTYRCLARARRGRWRQD